MNEDLVSQALARARAAARASSDATSHPSLAAEPPQPGDVLLHPDLTSLPVQWIVVAAEGAGGSFAVIPADPGSLVGSGDVALHEPGALRRWTARSRFPQPLFPAAVEGARRSGRLSAESLARIERRRAELAADKAGSFTEIETDHDPEYEDWLAEVVEPACRQWQELGVAKPLPFRPRVEPAFRQLRWAAGILAVLGLGAFTGLLLQAGRITKLGTAIVQQRAEAAANAAEHATRERGLAERLAASEEEKRVESERARDQIAAAGEELRKAREAALIVNPVLASLEPLAAVRGEAKAISLPSQASHLLLFLPVDQVVGGTLRIEIVGADGRLLWQRAPVARQKGHEISVGVPAALLPSGELVLRLYRRERGHEELIREHRLRVEREKSPDRPKGFLP